MPAHITGRITSADWKELPAGPAETTPRLARASVTNTFTGGIEADRTTCEYTIVYGTEKTGGFTGMELLAGRLEGREGSFVVEQRGTFAADGTVHCTFEVVPGTGTGELTGLTGTGAFTYAPGESSFPYTFDYDLG
ncbi:DUF3224 domain-containing protein [Streptomyces gibsoniae]|uniref:DUF3224 domain-containing protein n=1 Tax=Streptomyces gibsoniae TaxID=3075529 RepID=A0ABU2U6C4_9ACTN|nr:DUF3224 domain-containing protein [Streptomyces sp. DSM 41699]MDT0468705.1 DUF3224 domain-containing protein [Streptomyces sp. DSM 41699]